MRTESSVPNLVTENADLKHQVKSLQDELSETYRSVVELTMELDAAHRIAGEAERLADMVALNVTLAHTINNALQAIIGHADLGLNHCEIDIEIRSLFEVIKHEGFEIRDIVEKLKSIQKVHKVSYVSGTSMIDIENTPD